MRDIYCKIDITQKATQTLVLKQGDATRLILYIKSNGAAFDCSGATAVLNVLLGDDTSIVQQTGITITGSTVQIILDSRAVASAGKPSFELALTFTDGRVSSFTFYGYVAPALISDGTVESAAQDGIIDALTLSSRAPYIGANGDWYQYDDELGVFIDTGLSASGESGTNSDFAWIPTVSSAGVISWTKSASNTAPEAVNIKGASGSTFIPTVSSAGVLSWTNDGGLSNPSSVDLVTAVINALPTAVGVSF